jgi:hypothetical protein
MDRSVVILANSVTTMQFRRIAQETGIYQWERYIDASKVTNWEEIAIDSKVRQTVYLKFFIMIQSFPKIPESLKPVVVWVRKPE